MQFRNRNLHIFSQTMCRILRGQTPSNFHLVDPFFASFAATIAFHIRTSCLRPSPSKREHKQLNQSAKLQTEQCHQYRLHCCFLLPLLFRICTWSYFSGILPISTFPEETLNLQPTELQTFVSISQAVVVAPIPSQGIKAVSCFAFSGPVFAATESAQTNVIPRFSGGMSGLSKSFVARLIYSTKSFIVAGAQNDTSGILIALSRRTVFASLQHHGRGHAL